MYTLNYNIKINQEGRPYIELPPDFKNNNEDVFMALELSRYYLNDLIIRAKDKDILTEEEIVELSKAGYTLEQYSDQVAAIILKQMQTLSEVGSILEKQVYDIAVNTIEDRDDIKMTPFVKDDRFFERKEGFRVLIQSTGEIFELQGGIDNENWVKV